MIGDESSLPFSALVALRSLVGRNRLLAFLTMLAISTSVALVTALEVGSRSVQAELERTAAALAGAATLEVTGGELGIPLALLEKVRAVPGVLAASPLIQTTFRLIDEGHKGAALRVLGVDFLADTKVRSYSIVRDRLEIRDPLRLMTERSIVVTEILANRLGIGQGDALRVRSGDVELELVVRGLLTSGGLADAFQGQVAAMDVYSLQSILDRRGWIDRIDVVPEHDTSAEFLKERMEQRVAAWM